ncbi:MAG: hypothetical protein NTZ83_02020 [Candidatus Pacearchaeota archaeon]|nr:hypothetical protein [Candidatus Pacearchaeota archaeon]
MAKVLGFLIAFILLIAIIVVLFFLVKIMIVRTTENVLKLVIPFLH